MKEFEDLGFFRARPEQLTELRVKPIVKLLLLDDPITPQNRGGAISLILALEPEALTLLGDWTDLAGLGTLASLESLHLNYTLVTDLTPLKGLPKLEGLILEETKVTDLTPLKGLPSLTYLYLQNTGVTDPMLRTLLEGLPKLWGLDISNTKVTDLMPLKGLPGLRDLYLQNHSHPITRSILTGRVI